MSDDSAQDRCAQGPQQQANQNSTHNSTASVTKSAEFKTSVDDRTGNGVDVKHRSCCGDKLKDQAPVCDSFETPQQEPLRAAYRPNWWGITVGLFVVAYSFITFNRTLFSLAYVFGIFLIVVALLPASVSPAKIRCRNCGELFQEKLGRCPHCSPPP